MSFDDLMNDTVDLLKSDGTKRTGIKASVQARKIFMGAENLLVEPNDLVIRRMSNGAEETYRVIDPGFHEDFHGISAHYQMSVDKLGLPEAKSAVQHITYNISGNNARVNQSSIDNSINVVQVDARITKHIEALRKEIEASPLSAIEKTEANEVINEVESNFRSGKPRKSVVSALLNSLPQVANVASIVSAIASLAGIGA